MAELWWDELAHDHEIAHEQADCRDQAKHLSEDHMETGRGLIFMRHGQGTGGFQRIPQGHAPWRIHGFPRWCAVMVMEWALVAVPSLRAQGPKPTDYEVKAAYLYNFGGFVEWPATVMAAHGDSFTICVLGQDPFGPTLDAALAGETIAGKNVAVRRIPRPQDAVNCRILFISSSEDSQLKHILAALDATSVLTVSDLPQFSRRGGMVQFVLDGNRVRFEVNLTPADHAGLTLVPSS
jgi:hypothetical protein